jgi:hypothetical protein
MGLMLRRPRTILTSLAASIAVSALGVAPGPLPWTSTIAMAAETVTVENLSIETGVGTIRIPKLEAEGSSVSAAEIQSLLTTASGSDAAAKISAVSATRWSIPEIIFEQKLGAVAQTLTYRNVVLEDIASGRITRLNIAGGEIESAMPDGQRISGRFGAMSATGMNLAAVARIMTTTSSDPNEPLVTVYESFAAEGYEITMGDAGFIKVGIMAGRDFRMRPMSMSFTDLMKTLTEAAPQTPGAEPTPEQQTKALGAMPALLEVYKAYSFADVEVRDMEFSVKAPELITFKMANVGMKDFANARIGEMSFEGMSMSKAGAEGGSFGLGKFILRGLDFGDLLGDLQKVVVAMSSAQTTDPNAPPPSFTPADFHMPRFDEFAIEGLSFDGMVRPSAPAPADPAAATDPAAAPAEPAKLERIKMSLDRMAFTVRKWSNLMPTSFNFSVDKLFMQPDPADEKFAQMRAMGVDVLDMSLATSVDYDEAAQRLTFENLGFDMAKVGRINLKGTVENIPPETFSGNPEAAQMAMAMATVKTLEIEAADAGAIALILAQQSAATGMAPEQLREQFAAMPVAALPQILGQTQQVAELGNAISTFVRSGGTLKIMASSLSGVGMMDMADIPGMMAKTEIKATVAP